MRFLINCEGQESAAECPNRSFRGLRCSKRKSYEDICTVQRLEKPRQFVGRDIETLETAKLPLCLTLLVSKSAKEKPHLERMHYWYFSLLLQGGEKQH
jgi:hypothetical protein